MKKYIKFFNILLHFLVSVSDFCKKCDMYQTKMKAAGGNLDDILKLNQEK